MECTLSKRRVERLFMSVRPDMGDGLLRRCTDSCGVAEIVG